MSTVVCVSSSQKKELAANALQRQRSFDQPKNREECNMWTTSPLNDPGRRPLGDRFEGRFPAAVAPSRKT
jgi:hypothetical protein